jgi:hypothetical protein
MPSSCCGEFSVADAAKKDWFSGFSCGEAFPGPGQGFVDERFFSCGSGACGAIKALLFLHGLTQLVGLKTFAQPRRMEALLITVTGGAGRFNDDAVHGTGRQAQGAAGAFGGNHGMHQFAGADDRIYRAGGNTKRASDAGRLFDPCHRRWCCAAVGRVQWQQLFAEQRCDFRNDLVTARRTLVEGRCSRGNGVSIWPAAGVAALSALRLRQQGVDRVC